MWGVMIRVVAAMAWRATDRALNRLIPHREVRRGGAVDSIDTGDREQSLQLRNSGKKFDWRTISDHST
ncbi:hypothetical protein X798_07876 [Onchocerca flexuosa]|uniref:Uncharacterized protein n=1 Tax=Onchocerca flexuosa TaxID=387005 RepID=A0A238BKV5_9BILA|nr:hypothetical protein X798_07876 [Onchocerca flexuosa]